MSLETKKRERARVPAIRLTSTAQYTRPGQVDHSADIPLTSTHRFDYQPLGGAAESTKRCLESIRGSRSHNMVKLASHMIPLDVVDAIEAEVSAEFDAKLEEERAAKTLKDTLKQEHHAPSATQAEAALATVLFALPRHGIENKLVKTDFTNGSVGGPFPGSTSAYGKFQSETYWQQCGNSAAGRLKMGIPQRLAPNGTRLKNWNCEWGVFTFLLELARTSFPALSYPPHFSLHPSLYRHGIVCCRHFFFCVQGLDWHHTPPQTCVCGGRRRIFSLSLFYYLSKNCCYFFLGGGGTPGSLRPKNPR
jgi:hypothetical protein